MSMTRKIASLMMMTARCDLSMTAFIIVGMPRKISNSTAKSNTPPTVLQAVNRLKAEQERIIEEHKRSHVIRRRLER